MRTVIYMTGNELKFKLAKAANKDFGIELTQNRLDVDEVQGNDPEKVARDKADKAFKILKRPVFISDDSWSFSGLRGFPGVYMHDIAAWFTSDDFLHLTYHLVNRQVFLTQTIVYQDDKGQKLFAVKHEGELLKKAKGNYPGHPHFSVIALLSDKSKSMAEVFSSQVTDDILDVWKQLFKWLSSS